MQLKLDNDLTINGIPNILLANEDEMCYSIIDHNTVLIGSKSRLSANSECIRAVDYITNSKPSDISNCITIGSTLIDTIDTKDETTLSRLDPSKVYRLKYSVNDNRYILYNELIIVLDLNNFKSIQDLYLV